MTLFSAFICYAIAILICLGLPSFLIGLASKRKYKISPLHLIFGVIFFAVFFVCYYLVLRYHLTTSDGIAEYYNTVTYRVVIIALLTILAAVLLWIFGMIAYMRRQSYKSCLSFFCGFGSGGCIAIGGYALLMFVMLIIQCLQSSFVGFDSKVCAFYFSDETYFAVFQPMSGHVSFAVAAFCFLIISTALALMMNRITAAQVPFWISALSFVGIVAVLAIFLVVLCFMSMFGLAHYIMAIISVVCACLSVGLVYLTYRFVKQPDATYKKQFN